MEIQRDKENATLKSAQVYKYRKNRNKIRLSLQLIFIIQFIIMSLIFMMKHVKYIYAVAKESCADKNSECRNLVRRGYRKYCNKQWFVGESGMYGCQKSCGLC